MSSIELKVNSDMLDLKFEGYKLSLDPIPVLKQPVVGDVECIELFSEEYSYLQVRMSAFLNHLFQDPWCQHNVFYVNKDRCVYYTGLSQDGHQITPRRVWQLSAEIGSLSTNATLSFPSVEWCVFSNGSNAVFLLHTPSRSAGEPWMCYHEHSLSSDSQCYILHSVHRSLPNGQQIDCIIATVVLKSSLPENVKEVVDDSYVSLLEWISFSCDQNIQVWKNKRIRKFIGATVPKYATIDSSGDAICIASEKTFRMVFDSEQYIEQPKVEKECSAPLYTYIQTPEDITVVLRLPENSTKSDVQVNFFPTRMEVLLRGKNALEGNLENVIDVSGCKWLITDDNQKLEITISKAEVGLMWSELLKGDSRGEEIVDPKLAEEIHQRLAHLTSDTEATPSSRVPFNLEQLEECDMSNESLTFQRIDGNSCAETNKVQMGGHQWLFTQQLNPESLPAFCLRHDVDGILWQPVNIASEGEMEHFKMDHVATFPALGYVQASKQDKKFVSCSQDFSFSVITDCVRHVYLYCQPENLHSALQLRNRKTGELVSHIAKQYVVSLEQCDKILGLQISPQCIFVLSKQMLYLIKISVK